jgi:pre-mRNA-splicing factor ATP-dependent RNA helicase DHX15/PRP43
MNNGQSSKRNGSAHPLEGLVPGKVTLEQAQAIMDGDINPFKGDGTTPFSANYKKILQGRKQLPVFQKMKEFYDVFEKNQIVVMEGQTGSGKTTQYVSFLQKWIRDEVAYRYTFQNSPIRMLFRSTKSQG